MPARRSTLRVGTLAGIPIGIQPLWLVIVGLLTFTLGHDYFPQEAPTLTETAAYGLGLLSALGLFAGILLHELGHAIAARRRGVQVDEIDLWLLGGVSRIHGEPKTAQDELRFAIAGPAVTFVILLVLGAVRLAVGDALVDWARALLEYQLYVTGAILVFNLMPAFPLDGGRVVRALLWWQTGDQQRATAQAAAGGRVFGFLLIGLGVLSLAAGAIGGLWFALVGGFIVAASTAEEQGSIRQHALAGFTVSQLMSPNPATLEASLTLDEAIGSGFGRHLFTAFPVVDAAGRAVGVLSLAEVRVVPVAARKSTPVAQVMAREPTLLVEPGLLVTELLTRPAFARHGRAVVINPAGFPIGLISVTDIDRRLRVDTLLGTEPRVT